MKTPRFVTILILFFSAFLLSNCDGGDDWSDFRICGVKCPSDKPWSVETLDLNLPCFETKEACLEWAATHGYGESECIKCD